MRLCFALLCASLMRRLSFAALILCSAYASLMPPSNDTSYSVHIEM